MSSTKPAKYYVLVDCNNFYASCERVFDPSLANRPIVVLSSNDGCVIARSKEAKDIGIPMGAPAFECKHLFKAHDVAIFSSNFALYGNMSERVMQILSMFSPEMQVYSVDEAFLTLDPDQAEKIAYQMRETVLKWTGITVSVGVALTKTLAKVASACAKKKDGVFFLTDPEKIQSVLKDFPVGDVWGIGRRINESLKKQGIYYALDFIQQEDQWIRNHLSVVGLRMAWELRGTPCLTIEEEPAPKKAIISSKSFGRPVLTWEELAEASSSYMARAAEKAREEGSLASYLEVYLTTNPHAEGGYYANSAQVILPEPTAYTPTLISYGKQALKTIFKEGLSYKKTGVMLGGMVPKDCYQLDMLTPKKTSTDKQRKIMELMDHLNRKHGGDILKLAAQGLNPGWKMRQELMTDRYTTRWDELLTIQI